MAIGAAQFVYNLQVTAAAAKKAQDEATADNDYSTASDTAWNDYDATVATAAQTQTTADEQVTTTYEGAVTTANNEYSNTVGSLADARRLAIEQAIKDYDRTAADLQRSLNLQAVPAMKPVADAPAAAYQTYIQTAANQYLYGEDPVAGEAALNLAKKAYAVARSQCIASGVGVWPPCSWPM